MEPHTQMSIESLYSINHSHQDKKWWFNSWGYYWWIMDPTLVRKLQEKSVRNLRGNKKCEDNYTTKEEIEEILDEGTTRSSSALPVSGFAFESTPAAVP